VPERLCGGVFWEADICLEALMFMHLGKRWGRGGCALCLSSGFLAGSLVCALWAA